METFILILNIVTGVLTPFMMFLCWRDFRRVNFGLTMVALLWGLSFILDAMVDVAEAFA